MGWGGGPVGTVGGKDAGRASRSLRAGGEHHETWLGRSGNTGVGWGGCELVTGEGSSDSKAGLGGPWHRDAPAGRAFGQGQWLETSLCLAGAGIQAGCVLIAEGKALSARGGECACWRKGAWWCQGQAVVSLWESITASGWKCRCHLVAFNL